MVLRVVIIEDDRSLLATLNDYFELNNWEVFIFSDYESASKFNLYPFIDLIIADWFLPNEHYGVEIHKQFPNIPFILISARVDQNSLIRILSERVLFLAKPFTFEELESLINLALRGR